MCRCIKRLIAGLHAKARGNNKYMVRLAKKLSDMYDRRGLCVRLSSSVLSSLKARCIPLGSLRHLAGRGPDNIPLL
jgi:hypothetical protein